MSFAIPWRYPAPAFDLSAVSMTDDVLLWSCAAFLFCGMWWLLFRATKDALEQIQDGRVTWRQSAPFAISMVVACSGCIWFLLWAVTGGRVDHGLAALLLAAVALVLASAVCPVRQP
ncbi:hypothetical protein [Ralstonia sp. UNC404CL21Col]|uniref:hypothetical protein n=1 Tax=Ralstonia sp. UNC404CL21Col TaxID=1380362 RepID=UPI000482D0B7|nr:hypothetical protein [Ralstonia sp. UNC404CL21Col]